MTLIDTYSYTLESLLQSRSKGLALVTVPVSARPTRPSRLMRSPGSYLANSASTIVRTFTAYNPLRIFLFLGAIPLIAGLAVCARFLYFYVSNGGAGHVQSLIFAAIASLGGISLIVVGLLADLIQFNRRILEDIQERVRRLEIDR
jgi:hypothetical protein